jgi:Lamin Tail Domain
MKLRTALSSAAVIAAALVAAGPAVAGSAAAAPATARTVVISGIYYNSPGSDRGSNASLNHEWVRLHNTTGRAITMSGWTLRDAANHVFRFGTYRLAAHATVKIHTGRGRATRANRYWNRSWYIWNNTGDTATLRTAAGTFRARCKYSDPHERRAFTSC